MSTSPVMVGTDGSEPALEAVEWAAREAAARGLPLRIVSVPAMPPRMAGRAAASGGMPTVASLIYASAEHALSAAAAYAADHEPGLAIRTALLTGSPARVLAGAATGASMLVVGSRGGGGFAALVLGSMSRYVAFNAECPVVVVRQETAAVHRRVVVGVRDHDQSAAIAVAFEEAARRTASLQVIHGWQLALPALRLAGTGRSRPDEMTTEAAEWLAELMAPWRAKYPDLEVREDVVHASPSRVLVNASTSADLMVLGRNSRRGSGIPGTGTVLHAVLNHARCPVAIIPE